MYSKFIFNKISNREQLNKFKFVAANDKLEVVEV